MRLLLLILLIVFVVPLSKGASSKEDSLLLKYRSAKVDTQRFEIAVKIYSSCIRKGDLKQARVFSDSLLKLAVRIDLDKFKSSAYQQRANYFYKTNRFDSAIYYDNKSIEIAEKINYYQALMKCNVNLGNIYNNRSDYKNSILCLQKAEQYAILAKDTLGRIITTINLGNIYYDLNDYKSAKASFIKAINVSKGSSRYRSELSNAYNNFATVCLNETPKKLDSAMYYYNRYLELSIELGDENNVALANYNIAEVYRLKGDLKKAKEKYIAAKEIYTNEEDTVGLMKISLGLGDSYILENKNVEAIAILNEGLKYSYMYEMTSNTSNFLKSIAAAYYKMGNYKEAFDYFQKGANMSDSIYNADNSKILYDMQTKYETNEKEKQNKLLEAENIISHTTIRQQQLTTYFIIAGLLLTLLLAFFIFRGLRVQRKANQIITLQKEEVHKQKEIIEIKQKEMLDSIHYAKRIQDTLLVNKDVINSRFTESFILFKPKDIVSGDFYWATQKDNYFYLAVCDSTGHGVPGAFMSLLNVGFLSEAINEKNITEPHKIFDYVRDRLVASISKDGQKDGFDGILLRIDNKTNEIVYSAANNSPLLIRNGIFSELKADRMPVGIGERKENFNLYTLDFDKESSLYLYTDGYADQFGGEKGKKFKYKQLNELIVSCQHLSLEDQKKTLGDKFDEWRGDLEQVDDVCIIGIRL